MKRSSDVYFRPLLRLSKHRTVLLASRTNDGKRRALSILQRGSNSGTGNSPSSYSKSNAWLKWSALGASGALVGVALVAQPKRALTFGSPTTQKEDLPGKKESPKEEESSLSSWKGLSFLSTSLPVNTISQTLSTWKWPTLPNLPNLPDLPDLPNLPDLTPYQQHFSALLLELGRGPGSLYDEIVNEPPDPAVHPECEWDAEVRLGEELCLPERAFLSERKRKMRKAFADFIGVEEREVNEQDIPMIAIAGSGGGYRAMLNTLGSLSGAKQAGLFDCVAYTAGISGSCWSLGILYSGVAGSNNPLDAAEHAKDRIKLSYVDTATLEALVTPPTNKYLLTGILRKAAGPGGTASLVDLYGTLVASRILVPSDLTQLDPRHLSLHQFRKNIDHGDLPLPIFTALQHAVPPTKAEVLEQVKKEQDISVDESRHTRMHELRRRVEEETSSRWLWYEFTPYEVGCDELGAWIPSWALGRQFNNGKSLDRRPEMSFSILCGMFASAFCASLRYYFAEVQPSLRLLPVQLYTWLEEIITENEKDLGLIHPVLPDQVPNFMKGLAGQLRSGSPDEITTDESIGFMDAGAELNIPYYPLLRRDIDCIIALDASADSQDLWFKRAEELAVKRGLHTWPRGAGWPVKLSGTTGEVEESAASTKVEDDSEAANRELAEKQQTELEQQRGRQSESESRELPGNNGHDQTRTASAKSSPSPTPTPTPTPPSSCEIWIGSSKSTDSDSSQAARLEELEEEALAARDGIAIVYMPLVPNEGAKPGFDPTGVSTWRREVGAEESEGVLGVAETNFKEGVPKIRKLLRAIWVRKRKERERRESRERREEMLRHFLP